jgi:assimilatory nitrate reductase catalytic subunit
METKSTCPYCGVGCGVVIEHDGAQITGVRGDPDHPANFGRLCTKGSNLHLTATPLVLQRQRLLEPMRRERGAAPQAISWTEANTLVAERLLAIRAEHGPESIAFYISGQLLTEEYHAFNKLARGLIGTNHIDSNSRLCMSSAVVGYKQSLGADAPPACYDDLNHADCVFISGANPAWAHPILFRRLEDARAAKPAQKLIVVDPRRTETAELADLHLQIQPGTDVALCHGLLHLMIWEGWLDQAFVQQHTEGFDALKALVHEWTPARTAQTCGVALEDLRQAAQWFAQSGSTLSLYCMGLNQSSSGAAKNTALINLHLATGQIGRVGAGPFSLTGQPNAMGGRESGGMATLLPGHREPGNAQHRFEVARIWGLQGDEALPSHPGLTAVELFEAAARGEIKALWIACTNPAQSLPNQALVRAALEKVEFVILQEAFAHTATAAFADVLLPASTWGEKDGTVTNSERRISRVRAAVPAAGQAKPDWRIVCDIAQQMEAVLRPVRASLFEHASSESLWLEHREATRGRDLDITGLSYAHLDVAPQQWPFPEGAVQGLARLYQDRRFATPSGKARFITKPYRPPAERVDAQYPFALTTSRLRDQWHGMSRSGQVPKLFAHAPLPALKLHPQDAARRRLAAGDWVQLQTRRGRAVLPLQLDANVGLSQADLPMHWGSEYLAGAGGVNALTQGALCPDARQPELKYSALAVSKAELPWRCSAAIWLPSSEAPALHRALQKLLQRFDAGYCVPVPSSDLNQTGLLLELAHAQAPTDPARVTDLAALLNLGPGASTLRYADSQRGRLRLLRLNAAEGLQALMRVGEGDEGAWLVPLWRQQQSARAFGRWLLSPGAPPQAALTATSAQVCNCFDVREDAIQEQLLICSGSPAERLAQLQGSLRCGTQCGSCLPALRRWVATTKEEVSA